MRERSGEKCGNCEFYEPGSSAPGECVRYPPTIGIRVRSTHHGGGETSVRSDDTCLFPRMLPADWCGEWK